MLQLLLGKVAVSMASQLGSCVCNMILHEAGLVIPNDGDPSLNVKNELDLLAKQQAQIASKLDQLEIYVKNDKIFKDVNILRVKLDQEQAIGDEYLDVANALYVCVGKPKQFEMEVDGVVDIISHAEKLSNGDPISLKLHFESWYKYLVHLYSVCLAVAIKKNDQKGQQIISKNLRTMSDRMLVEFSKKPYGTFWRKSWASGWELSLVLHKNIPTFVNTNPKDGRVEMIASNHNHKDKYETKWEAKWKSGWINVASLVKNNRVYFVVRNSDGRIECDYLNEQNKVNTIWEEKWKTDWCSTAATLFKDNIYIFSLAPKRVELGYVDASNKYHTVFTAEENMLYGRCSLFALQGRLFAVQFGTHNNMLTVSEIDSQKRKTIFTEEKKEGWASFATVVYADRVFYFATTRSSSVQVGEILVKEKTTKTLWTEKCTKSWEPWNSVSAIVRRELVAGEIRPVLILAFKHYKNEAVEMGTYALWKHF